MKQGKVWGTTDEFFRNAMVSSHYLEIKKGGHSSKHRHSFKFNQFYVTEGELQITIWRENDVLDITVLHPGESSAVHPGFFHMFKALKETKCVETYQALLIDPDIERENQGGLNKS